VVNEAFARDARSVPISHSLGTIIGYNVLMNRAERSNITTSSVAWCASRCDRNLYRCSQKVRFPRAINWLTRDTDNSSFLPPGDVCR